MLDRYAVIGNPIAHSKSPDIHAAFAAATNQSMSYERLLAPLENFRTTLDAFRQSGALGSKGYIESDVKGCNITVPFKLDAFNYATELSDRARRAGAVNTLGFDGARIWGDNTDGVGLVRDIENNLGVAIRDSRVLLMGAGGAARGVAGALADAKPATLAITNRTLSKAEEIAQHEPTMKALSVESLSKHQFDIIINATSASLSGDLPAVPRSAFAQDCFAYDMMYRREPTPFMQLAADAGARTADGLGMLVEQAAEAFWLWRGVRPATAAVLTTMKQSLLA
jgi:shikimate dehydrogenase